MSSCSDCCDTCQVCINCDDTCNTCQSFCEVGKQTALTHLSNDLLWPEIHKDDIIIKTLPRDKYNKAFTYISKASNLGTKVDSSRLLKENGTWTGKGETRNFIYADKTNEIIDGINSMMAMNGGSFPLGPFKKDVDIIYASYFEKIRIALKNLKLYQYACNECNVTCDVSCDTCDTCDSCQGSNGYWPSDWHSPWDSPWPSDWADSSIT